ncbi:hypothetical protein HWV62_36979 [Athelia sp. TMB]|nr:hypothetical protein HWV62_36979 [Athelia sp. TMB]
MGNTSSTSKRNSNSHSLNRTQSAIFNASAGSTIITGGLRAQSRSRSANPDTLAPPPAYDGATTGSNTRGNPDKGHKESHEDVFEALKDYDTVLIVDDSASMTWEDRWGEARRALSALAALAAPYDVDGIDLHFLNSAESVIRGGAKEIEDIFERVKPSSGTPIGRSLDIHLGAYMDNAEAAKRAGLGTVRPANFIILTDGAPTDSPEDVIVDIARRLRNGNFPVSQLGVQFVQVGSDLNAQKYLKGLDDTLSLKHDVRDIVDTTPYAPENGQLTAEMLLKIAMGGINRRLDRDGTAL